MRALTRHPVEGARGKAAYAVDQRAPSSLAPPPPPPTAPAGGPLPKFESEDQKSAAHVSMDRRIKPGGDEVEKSL